MPYSILSSAKILTLATAPFLFILVGVLCLSVNLLWCQECAFYCPFRKKRCTLLPEGNGVHILQLIHQKDLNLCLPLRQGHFSIGKNTKNLTFMVLIIRPSSTLKFLFGFN